MARLIVPYTRRLPEVENALRGAPLEAAWLYTGADDTAYWEVLEFLWKARETFILVEHDIVPTADILAEMLACPGEWCAAGYAFENYGLIYGLGCTKFESSLMSRVPDLLDTVGAMSSPQHPARHWCNLDDRIKTVLYGRGLRGSHAHGEVQHLSPWRSHACA